MRQTHDARYDHPATHPPAPDEDDEPVAGALRDVFDRALRQIGGEAEFARWARDNPDRFFALYARRAPPAAAEAAEPDAELTWLEQTAREPELTREQWLEQVRQWRISTGELAPDASREEPIRIQHPSPRGPSW